MDGGEHVEVHPMEELRLSSHADVPVVEVMHESGPTLVPGLAPLATFDDASAVGLLGDQAAPDDLMFGSLADATFDESGNVFLLDEGYHVVRVLDPSLRSIQIFGGEGEGPGELRRPESLAWMPQGELAVLDGSQRLELFRIGGDGWEWSGRRFRLGIPRPLAACETRGTLFVRGPSLSVDGTAVTGETMGDFDFNAMRVGTNGFVHEVDAEGNVARSFSTPYDLAAMEFEDPNLGIYVADRGGLACDAGRVWVGYGILGEVHAFGPDGQLEWITRITDLDFPGYRFRWSRSGGRLPRSGGLDVDAVAGGWAVELLDRVMLLTPTLLAAQVWRREVGTAEEEYRETITYRTHLLDARTGESLGWFSADHRILGGRDGRVVQYRELPYPRIAVVNVTY